MKEPYTNEQFKKYEVEHSSIAQKVVGNVIKYGSFITGIYSVCKDEKDFALASFMGLTYCIGDLIKKNGDQSAEIKRFSKLEDTLRK